MSRFTRDQKESACLSSGGWWWWWWGGRWGRRRRFHGYCASPLVSRTKWAARSETLQCVEYHIEYCRFYWFNCVSSERAIGRRRRYLTALVRCVTWLKKIRGARKTAKHRLWQRNSRERSFILSRVVFIMYISIYTYIYISHATFLMVLMYAETDRVVIRYVPPRPPRRRTWTTHDSARLLLEEDRQKRTGDRRAGM